MGYVCKGNCIKYKFGGTMHQWYKHGAKYCSSCEIYMIVEGYRCLCCGSKLRGRVRNTKLRRLIKQKQEVEYILI